MIELRFHNEFYDGFAVDEAAKAYAAFASMDLSRESNGYIVRVTALPSAALQGISESDIGAELMNYALGKTIERASAAAPSGAEAELSEKERA